MLLHEVPCPGETRRLLEANHCPNPTSYESDTGLFIVVTFDDTIHHGKLKHVSISHEQRYPTWEEIKLIRNELFAPYRDVMMVLPREGNYVNVHKNCFHLWQTPEEWKVG